MLGHGAIGQFAIGEVRAGAAEFIGPDKFMSALAEPVRFRARLNASEQQFFAFNPVPVVSFSWFEALTEPARQRPRSPAALYPNFFFQPAPSPFVATGWFQALSEPVRKRPGLPPQLQMFFATDTAVIPVSKLIEWFMALSEPVRFRPGLKAALQQFLATPSQLRPNPTTTGVLAALETKDTFLGGARVFNRVTSGEVGVIESNFSGGQIGVVVQALSPGTSGLIAPVAVPASGSAVPAVTTAHVSIRII